VRPPASRRRARRQLALIRGVAAALRRPIERNDFVKKVTVRIDPHYATGELTPKLFGSFIEHIGRAVYGGIYDPEHPTADDEGFRGDVLELVKELGVTRVRYPGGNFVSGFRWEDSVGPRSERPHRRELAWHSTETNEVGLHEFVAWARKADLEVLYALNLGTRDTQAALELLDYANGTAGSALADQRIGNGAADPFGIKTWYLGNEMDGPWQLGHRTATEYGRLASSTASGMRQYDPTLDLVACGSSHMRMKTFGHWEREVLLESYDEVDQISCHAYYEELGGDLDSFLASGEHLNRYVQAVATTIEHVRTLKRTDKRVKISFDEWNVWYLEGGLKGVGLYRSPDIAGEEWPVAPRVAEDVYSVADAVVVGNLLMNILKNAHVIGSASLSMLVNSMAPIRTEPGGIAWRQTSFHPYALTAKHARGSVLEARVDSDTYSTAQHGDVSLVDVVATFDRDGSSMTVLVANRSQTETAPVHISIGGAAAHDVTECLTLSETDHRLTNSAEEPDRVIPRPNDSATILSDGTIRLDVPPISWTILVLNAEVLDEFAATE
jgi:alpha-L-arabinofuranosidase